MTTPQRLAPDPAIARVRASFIHACTLDVAVRKPGNVSRASAGHGMRAAQFEASARAAAEPLCAAGARVGDRIEAAVAASWQAAGCNTNLGIVLLCAPLARAAESEGDVDSPAQLRRALDQVLSGLDVADAVATYRAIAQARPGGLGRAAAQDVHDAPDVDLRAAMALAADRDSIALQYRDGYAELFALGVRSLIDDAPRPFPAGGDAAPSAAAVAAVQRVYLAFLSCLPDSHIVRKHGGAVAQSVMRSAQAWQARAMDGLALDTDPDFAAWDDALKAARVNPGTSADLTVAALFAAGLIRHPAPGA